MQPTVQHIAITRTDGGLSVMQFVTDDGVMQHEATDEAINATIAKAGIDAVSWRRIEPEDIPTDRADRAEWIDTGTAIAVDQVKRAKRLANAVSVANYKAMIRRRAHALAEDGDEIGALLLIKTIGD